MRRRRRRRQVRRGPACPPCLPALPAVPAVARLPAYLPCRPPVCCVFVVSCGVPRERGGCGAAAGRVLPAWAAPGPTARRRLPPIPCACSGVAACGGARGGTSGAGSSQAHALHPHREGGAQPQRAALPLRAAVAAAPLRAARRQARLPVRQVSAAAGMGGAGSRAGRGRRALGERACGAQGQGWLRRPGLAARHGIPAHPSAHPPLTRVYVLLAPRAPPPPPPSQGGRRAGDAGLHPLILRRPAGLP